MQQCDVQNEHIFQTNIAECLKQMQCSPEANTELHSGQEVLVTEQDNFNLKVSTIFMAVSWHVNVPS